MTDSQNTQFLRTRATELHSASPPAAISDGSRREGQSAATFSAAVSTLSHHKPNVQPNRGPTAQPRQTRSLKQTTPARSCYCGAEAPPEQIRPTTSRRRTQKNLNEAPSPNTNFEIHRAKRNTAGLLRESSVHFAVSRTVLGARGVGNVRLGVLKPASVHLLRFMSRGE